MEDSIFENIVSGEKQETKFQTAHEEFSQCVFRSCNFQDTAFTGSRFLDCRFEVSNLSNAKFDSATLHGATFTDCKLVGILWNDIKSAWDLKFENCILDFSSFTRMNLKNVVIRGCRAIETDFSGANLTGALFAKSDLKRAVFNGADLASADFRDSLNYSIAPGSVRLKKTRFSLPEAMNLLHGLDIILD